MLTVDLTAVLVFIILVLVAILLYRSVRNGGAASLGGVIGGAIDSLRGKKKKVQRRGGADTEYENSANPDAYIIPDDSDSASDSASDQESADQVSADTSSYSEETEISEVSENPSFDSEDGDEPVKMGSGRQGNKVDYNKSGAYRRHMDVTYNTLHRANTPYKGGGPGANWKLYVSEPHFTNIKNGKKDVELRINRPIFAKNADKGKILEVMLSPRPADSQKDESYLVKVVDFETFKTLSEALDKKTLARVAPGLSKAEATLLARKYILEDVEKEFGIVALTLQRVDAAGKTMKAQKNSHRVLSRGY